MFIFVIQTLQKKWNQICKKQLAGGKCMENKDLEVRDEGDME
jgi:hypothetical protein